MFHVCVEHCKPAHPPYTGVLAKKEKRQNFTKVLIFLIKFLLNDFESLPPPGKRLVILMKGDDLI